MAHRRCLGALVRHCRPLVSPSIQRTLTLEIATHTSIRSPLSPPRWIHPLRSDHPRNLSSRRKYSDDDDDNYQYQLSEDEDDDEEEEEEEEEEVEDGGAPGMRRAVQSGKTEEEKLKEAAEIGYVVTGPLEPSEKPFKLWEPVYAVVQLGSHQFKVSNGDSIFTERLKYCDVNDKDCIRYPYPYPCFIVLRNHIKLWRGSPSYWKALVPIPSVWQFYPEKSVDSEQGSYAWIKDPDNHWQANFT